MIRRATLEDVADVNRWNERDFGQTVDFSEFLSSELNVCLVEGEGGALFAWRGPGTFEAHAFFEQRGREVLNVSEQMLAIMRKKHGARMFWSAVPIHRRNARMYCRLLGWKHHRFAEFSGLGPCEIFVSENVKCLL